MLLASYKKQVLPDPVSEGKTYTNYQLLRNSEFCCAGFKDFCKKFTVWNYDKGRFTVVDNISYEGHNTRPISFCPFCGEKIELKEVKN